MALAVNPKQKPVTETNIYHSLINLNREFIYSMNTLQKDIKIVYGQEALRFVAKTFALLKEVYEDNRIEAKINKMVEMRKSLDCFGYFVKILRDCCYLNEKRMATIGKFLGTTLEQINKWLNATKNKLEKQQTTK